MKMMKELEPKMRCMSDNSPRVTKNQMVEVVDNRGGKKPVIFDIKATRTCKKGHGGCEGTINGKKVVCSFFQNEWNVVSMFKN